MEWIEPNYTLVTEDQIESNNRLVLIGKLHPWQYTSGKDKENGFLWLSAAHIIGIS